MKFAEGMKGNVIPKESVWLIFYEICELRRRRRRREEEEEEGKITFHWIDNIQQPI